MNQLQVSSIECTFECSFVNLSICLNQNVFHVIEYILLYLSAIECTECSNTFWRILKKTLPKAKVKVGGSRLWNIKVALDFTLRKSDNLFLNLFINGCMP